MKTTQRRWRRRTLQPLLIVLCVASHAQTYATPQAREDELDRNKAAKVIPLDHIWAQSMPNTKRISALDPRKDEPNAMSAVSAINRLLSIRSSEENAKAGQCCLVEGEGKESLYSALAIIEKRQPIPEFMPAGKPLTLFFYTHFAPGYVCLDSVYWEGTRLKVNYKVVIHQTTEATIHFALIPVGKLSAGKINVDVIEVKPPIAYRNQAVADRAVCDSCAFDIKEKMP